MRTSARRKLFFFEKKNQKLSFVQRRGWQACRMVGKANSQKIFLQTRRVASLNL
jgi:hypothetical protein